MLCNTDKSLIGVSLAERTYNINTIETKSAQLSETLTSKSTQTQIVVITHPVMAKDSNEILGYIGTSVYAQSMADILVADEHGHSHATESYIYLIDENGNYIYNPNEELVGQPVEIAELLEIVGTVHTEEEHEHSSDEEHTHEEEHNHKEKENNIVSFVDNGEAMVGSYSLVPNTNWTLVHATPKAEIQAPVQSLSMFLLLVGALVVGTMIAGVILLAIKISKPIRDVSTLVDKMAKLNLELDNSIDYLAENSDETGMMSSAIMKMKETLREIVKLLEISAGNVNNSATEINQIVDEIYKKSNDHFAITKQLEMEIDKSSVVTKDITQSVQVISTNVDDIVVKTAEDILKVIANVNTSVSNITDSSQRMLNFLNEDIATDYIGFIQSSEQYSHDARVITEMMTSIESATEGLVSSIAHISNNVDKVVEVVEQTNSGVADIAKQTNETVGLMEVIEKKSKENAEYAKEVKNIAGKFTL